MIYEITTDRDLLKPVLRIIQSIFNVQPKAIDVLYWLCTKADDTGTVVVIAKEYREELKLSRQGFNNYIGDLKKSGLVTGERDVLKVASHIPIKAKDSYELTIQFKRNQ
jgi:hypothetical protein